MIVGDCIGRLGAQLRAAFRIAATAAIVLPTTAAESAAAKCAGRDLMASLAASQPEVHAAIVYRGRQVPNGEGKLWRVEKKGTRPSWLFGTLHSTEAAARWLPRTAVEAFGEARIVMVELAPAEQERLETRLAEDPSFGLRDDGPPLTERLHGAVLDEAADVLAARGMSLETADRLKPCLIISTIAVPLCEQKALAAGGRLLDDAIAQEAAAWGVPVASLESYEQTFAAFEQLSEAEMTSLLEDGFVSAAHEEDLRRTLEILYDSGKIAAIMEFNIWNSAQSSSDDEARESAEALSHALIEVRNRQWMDRLVPELEKGGVFAAFGALHLPGEAGVVALLRKRGFTVTRVVD